MRKNKLIISLVTLIFISFSGCGNTNSIEVQDSASDDVIIEDTQDDSEFYGMWSIEKLLYYSYESENIQDDIDSIVGQTIEFYENQINYNDNSYMDPVYNETDLSEEDFSTEEGMTFSSLGIEADTIKQIKVENYDGDVGGVFYIKDDNTLIIAYGESYLEATRIN